MKSTMYKALLTVCIMLVGGYAAIAQLTVAVLPFDVITNDGSIMYEAMAGQIQNECVISMRDNAPKAKVKDTRTVNAILAKNNISWQDMAQVSPKEMIELLDVDFVIFGTANIENKAVVTRSASNSGYREDNNETKTHASMHDKNKNVGGSTKSTKSSGSSYSSNSTTTKAEYQSRISLEIYDKNGENVHSVSRTGMSQDLSGYLPTLHYLIKRTPFGKKYKAK